MDINAQSTMVDDKTGLKAGPPSLDLVVEREYRAEEKERRELEWTEQDERRIQRRMDLRIVPAVFLLYLLCFIDS
jgi:hypothetical protein